MKEEFFLEQKFGRRGHFKVPEGYFGHFEEKFLRNLQDSSLTRIRHRAMLIRYVACAACLVFIVISGFLLFNAGVNEEKHSASNMSNNNSSSFVNDYMIDEISDYAMLDNDDIYSYVSGE